MTGAAQLLLAGETAGGYVGTPGAVMWGNIVAFDGGVNNLQTLTGVTGAMSVRAAITGSGNLFYALNGSPGLNYAGPFLWPAGETLCWGVNSGGGNVSGTITVTNASADTALSTFTYSVRTSTSGDL